ncbi:iron-dependent transcriptional regulator, partial [gut metagenome]
MLIRKSAEDYLETVLMLKEKKGAAHSVDVATELGFSKASVSVAMKKLRESGYLIMEPDGELRLTDSGFAIASRIYERHRALTDFSSIWESPPKWQR